MRSRAFSLVTVTGLALLGGCARTPVAVDEGEAALTPPEAAERLAAIQPTELRVHGLTRLERGSTEDGARVLVYLELLDQFGQDVKGLGRVTIELRVRGLAAPGADPGERQRRYVRDLSEPKANADALDWITRCYIVPCGELPERLREAALRGDLEVDAAMSVLQADGSRRVLRAAATIPPPPK